ncbi:MAG: hypothetical protein P1Q69_14215 [Candidatus Thorarchaeota archaeon]|nr:hypothetical protein [Candidatus Thorarchaeota archaeon]
MDLLIAIQENPLATLDWLADRTKVSKPTTAKRLAVLEGSRPQNISIRDPEQGRIFTVTPLLSYHNLGFEYSGAIVETKSLKQTNKLEKLISYHPYIRHRSRCYGAANGILMQFRSPEGSMTKILEFLDQLVERKLASGYRILPSNRSPPVYSSLSARDWDLSTLTWDFDWDEWFAAEATDIPKNSPKGPSGNALSWLMKKDIYLMNEIIRSARRKNKAILEALRNQGIDFTPQTFSRRYTMMKDTCFIRYRTFIDPKVFDVYNNVVITGQASKSYLKKLSVRLNSNPIPFESSMRIAGSELFWYVRLQGAHLSKLISRMSSDMDDLRFYILDYSESFRYFLEPEAYNDDEHKWIQDDQFMIYDVLKN